MSSLEEPPTQADAPKEAPSNEGMPQPRPDEGDGPRARVSGRRWALPERVSRWRALVVVLLFAVAGTAIGMLVVPRGPVHVTAPEAAPTVSYLGEALEPTPGAIDRALNRTRKFSERQFTLRLPDGKFRTFSLGTLGASIDKARLTQLVHDVRDATSPLRVTWKDQPEAPRELPVPIEVDADQALSALLELKDRFDRLPQEARIDLEKRKVVPEVVGRKMDVDATLIAIDEALQTGTLTAEARFIELVPHRRAKDLANVEFDAVIGYFETRYDRSARSRDRTYNLRQAATKLDGTVLMPGDVFDFNEVVGPRDEANGYKVATVIANGELVDGIGGGTCQISGTLHGAAFFAGLDIVERYPHTRPSSYIKMGMDATVVYPTINFRFRNSFDFPIVLHQTVKNGTVRAEILGPAASHTVTLIRRIDSAIPYEQLERPEPRLPRGERRLVQRGIPGFRLHRYRITRHGKHAIRERWNDVYPPTAQVIGVGTGERVAESRPGDDRTPEYVADELLVMTLRTRGGGVDDADEDDGPDYIEDRERGRFGERGWTKEASMPFWEGS